MAKKLLIRDLTLRDGQQSQFATRMNQNQVDRLLKSFNKAHFYAMEVWGGAVPDSVMRYLGEDPWARLEKVKAGVGDASKLTALSRGRNLFGYNPYPEDVIEGFNRNAIKSGIDIMRIFDALNDIDNMRSTIKYVKENGGMTDCCICYTVDPKFSTKDKIKAMFSGKKLPDNLFSIDYFVNKAIELEKAGADMISIKDMAGLINPAMSAKLISALKKAVKIPIDLHTHCTPGYGLGSVLMAMVNDVDIVDSVIMPFAGGPAAPAFELIQVFAQKLGLETNVDLAAVKEIRTELFKIRKELAKFDQYKLFPKDFDPTDKLPADVEKLFDDAIAAAKKGDTDTVTDLTQQIERYFNFPKPNEVVRMAQIPGALPISVMEFSATSERVVVYGVLFHLRNLSLHFCSEVLADGVVDIEHTTTTCIHHINISTTLGDSLDGLTNLVEDGLHLLLLSLLEILLALLCLLLDAVCHFLKGFLFLLLLGGIH